MSTATARTANDELDGLYVFHARRLRDGVELASTARFADDSWPLGPATLQRHERGLVLHFGTVPDRYRLALKRLCYLALSGPLPAAEPRPTISQVLSIFYRTRTFLGWLDQHQAAEQGPPSTASARSPQRIWSATSATCSRPSAARNTAGSIVAVSGTSGAIGSSSGRTPCNSIR